MFKIKKKNGEILIINQIVCLAPMAGYTNSAYRQIAKEYGAGICFAEMVSDKGLSYNNAKTLDLLKTTPLEHPLAQQIFGSDLDTLVKAAKFIDDNMDCDIIDINMGCPVPKVALRTQAGASLLKNPQKVFNIVKAIVDACNKPISVKIRSGWDSDSINAVDIAKKIEAAGASLITIHGRTRAQGYSGKVDLNIIKSVKQAVSIPVIGNGDITDCLTAKYMLDYTGVDGIMIGRASLGNPWIFNQINHYLQDKNNLEHHFLSPTVIERKNVLLKHFNLLVEQKGLHLAILEIRGIAPQYLKGLPHASSIRNKLVKISSYNEFIACTDDYFNELLNNHELHYHFKKVQKSDLNKIIEYKKRFQTHKRIIPGSTSLDAFDDIERYFLNLEIFEDQTKVPTGFVMSKQFCLIDNNTNKIVALASLRYELNESLLKYGGHIGYSVDFDYQNKGLGTFLLKLSLKEIRKAGIDKVLITCNDDNIASEKVILKNSGILENIIKEENKDNYIKRYWINLNSST